MEYMKQHLIRSLLFPLALWLACCVSASAQTGLNVDKVFQLYGKAKGCKMVVMSNTTVIYIEGTLSPDDIMKLCYSRF